MGFIQYIDAFIWGGQDDTSAHSEIGKQQRMVDHQYIGAIHVVAGAMKGAVLVMAQRLVAGVAVGGDAIPASVGNGLWPVVPIPVPFAIGVGLPQGLVAIFVAVRWFGFAQTAKVELKVGHLGTTGCLLQQMFATVALAPFDQHETKRQLAVAVVEGEVFVDQLLLQRHGGGGDHQLLLGKASYRNSALCIGE